MASNHKGFSVQDDFSVVYDDDNPSPELREKAQKAVLAATRERASRADGVTDEGVRQALAAEGVVVDGTDTDDPKEQ